MHHHYGRMEFVSLLLLFLYWENRCNNIFKTPITIDIEIKRHTSAEWNLDEILDGELPGLTTQNLTYQTLKSKS